MVSSRLDLEYSPSTAAREPARSLRRYRERSDAARRRLRVHQRVPYGKHRDEVSHLFPAGRSGTPALVFVHGGHWQESGIDDACFAAENAVTQGFAYVAVGYGLAPSRTLPEMIDAVTRALVWIADTGPSFGIDPDALYVAGSSAGAHLVAAALTRSEAPRVRGACLLSGLYDLEEVPRTYVNHALGLSDVLAGSCSPVRMAAPRCDAILLATARYETETYQRQQHAYAAVLTAFDVPFTSLVVEDRDHFDLPLDLADQTTPFGQTTLSHWGKGRSAP